VPPLARVSSREVWDPRILNTFELQEAGLDERHADPVVCARARPEGHPS